MARPFNVGSPIMARSLAAPSGAVPVAAPVVSQQTVAMVAPKAMAKPVRAAPLEDGVAAPAAAGKLSELYYNSDLPPIERFQKDGPFKKFRPRTMEDLLKSSN